ncbi:MAG: serine/threonine-protein kinase, partial [Gammaproteobacteria bacterium]|nr:serine/threonine-protein kinase [Gammaproteobacteria bacterium]
MSQLLEEALPLDPEQRCSWMQALPPEHQDLAQAMRDALFGSEAQLAQIEKLAALPESLAASSATAAFTTGPQGGARVGPYELLRPLGKGGMAEVWLARRADGAFRREVALKLPIVDYVRGDLAQRFAHERDILASLEHPHIARFYDAGLDQNGSPYLSMEYVEGQPLTEWCDAHRLGIRARLELFLQTLAAVQYAHDKQVIHRDLKPSNVLVTRSGEVRLLDFGVARLLEQHDPPRSEITAVHGRALTPDYASPELLRGEAVDARGDIYSLGVLLYELLTGVRPYRLRDAASVGLLEDAIVTVEVKKPSTQLEPAAAAARGTTADKLARQLRGDLDAIALKSLAKRPAQRYASVAALAEDVRCHLQARPIEALPRRFTDRVWKFARRNATVAVTAAAVAGLTAALAFLLAASLRQNPGRLWLDPLAGARVVRLTDFAGTERAGAISRDGRFAAFLATRDGRLDVWLTEIGTNRYHNVTEGKFQQLGNPEIRTVGFSPDGALVTFWTRVRDGSRAQDINVMAAPTAGGALQPYLRETAEYDWSPDGHLVVFHTTAPGDPLFVRAALEASGRQIYVAAPGIHCHFLTWSPDGKFIYFVRGDPASADW